MNRRQGLFDRFAQSVNRLSGKPPMTALSMGVVLSWLSWCSWRGWTSDRANVISVVADAFALFMLFVIIAAQNRDTRAIHVKLDFLLSRLGIDRENFSVEEWNEGAQEEMRKRLAKDGNGMPLYEQVEDAISTLSNEVDHDYTTLNLKLNVILRHLRLPEPFRSIEEWDTERREELKRQLQTGGE